MLVYIDFLIPPAFRISTTVDYFIMFMTQTQKPSVHTVQVHYTQTGGGPKSFGVRVGASIQGS